MNFRSSPYVLNKNSRGFTLVEMLVVIVIITLIMIGGYFAYTSYINAARDERVIADGREIHRAIEFDTVAAKGSLASGGLAENLTSSSTCEALLDKVVEKLYQQNKRNPFNGSSLVQTAVQDGADLQRGSIYISCAVPQATIDSPNFYLQTCICTESNCPLTSVPSVGAGVDPLPLDKNICYRL